MVRYYNEKIENINVITQGSDHGICEDFNGNPNIDMVWSHMQGMAVWSHYLVFSSNDDTTPVGVLLIVNMKTRELVQKVSLSSVLPHPGGIQRIGDFIAVPNEVLSSRGSSEIVFYDFSGVNDTTAPKIISRPYIYRSGKKAGGVGITNYTAADGEERYVLAVNDNGVVDIYESNAYHLGDFSCEFTYKHTFCLTYDASEVCLVTDKNNKVYLIAFCSIGEGLSFKDIAQYYEIGETSVTPLGSRQFITKHPNQPGAIGVHFRYGAGLQIQQTPDGNTFYIYCSARNFVLGGIATNFFYF